MQLLIDLAEGPEHRRVDATLHVNVDPIESVIFLELQVGFDEALCESVLLRFITGFVHPRARPGRTAERKHVAPRVHRDACTSADVGLGGHALVLVGESKARFGIDALGHEGVVLVIGAHIGVNSKGTVQLEPIGERHRDHVISLFERIPHCGSLLLLKRRERPRTPVGDEQFVKRQVAVACLVALHSLLVHLDILG